MHILIPEGPMKHPTANQKKQVSSGSTASIFSHVDQGSVALLEWTKITDEINI